MHAFFFIFFHYDLSQGIDYSSLCYTLGSCCLSVLHIIYVCFCSSQSSNPLLPSPSPWQPQRSFFYHCFVIVAINQVSIYICVYFWSFYFVPLVYVPMVAPIPICLYYYNYVRNLEKKNSVGNLPVLLFL